MFLLERVCPSGMLSRSLSDVGKWRLHLSTNHRVCNLTFPFVICLGVYTSLSCAVPRNVMDPFAGAVCAVVLSALWPEALYFWRAWNKGSFISLPQAISAWPKRAQHSCLKLQCRMELSCCWRLIVFVFYLLISVGGGGVS
uniref:Putative suppressor of cytokine signaling 6 n=1 Tax=Ixodes ricinus TaxID=34613 RepID=A0A0K8R3J7_IXORI